MHAVVSRLVVQLVFVTVLGAGLSMAAMPAASAPHVCPGKETPPVVAATSTTPQAPVGAGWG